VKPNVYERLRMLWRTEPLLIVRGVLQNRDGVPNVIAINAEALPVEKTMAVPHSKDFS
jgi:hypothetical protein